MGRPTAGGQGSRNRRHVAPLRGRSVWDGQGLSDLPGLPTAWRLHPTKEDTDAAGEDPGRGQPAVGRPRVGATCWGRPVVGAACWGEVEAGDRPRSVLLVRGAEAAGQTRTPGLDTMRMLPAHPGPEASAGEEPPAQAGGSPGARAPPWTQAHSQTPAESAQIAGAPSTPGGWRDASLEEGGGGEPPH